MRSAGDAETVQFSQELCRSVGVTISVSAGATTSTVGLAATRTALESTVTGGSAGNGTREGGLAAMRTGSATNGAARMVTQGTGSSVVFGVIVGWVFVV